MKKFFKFVFISILILIILFIAIHFYVVFSTKNRIVNDDLSKIPEDVDCIIVLGAGVWSDSPSPMLEDRLDEGIKLYNQGVSKKIIMSGDHGRTGYDEVNIMKQYAIDCGVPSEDIFMDHAGFSTYESMYRAKAVFGAKKIVIVTQKYHLFRALYIARRLGMEAYGVGADPRKHAGAEVREMREVLARDKDFFKCIFKPQSTYVGEKISLKGSGDVTND